MKMCNFQLASLFLVNDDKNEINAVFQPLGGAINLFVTLTLTLTWPN